MHILPSPGGMTKKGWVVSPGWCMLPCGTSSSLEYKHLQGFTWSPLLHAMMKSPSKALYRGTTYNTGDEMAPRMWVLLWRPCPQSISTEVGCHLCFVREASEMLSSLTVSSELYDSQVLHFLPSSALLLSFGISENSPMHRITTTRSGP